MRCGATARCTAEDCAACPTHFVTAQDLTPAEHVRMQAAVQRHVDSAISKTVNVPEDISFAAFQEVYRDAYRSGCKGCTTYRPERGHRVGARGEARRSADACRRFRIHRRPPSPSVTSWCGPDKVCGSYVQTSVARQ